MVVDLLVFIGAAWWLKRTTRFLRSNGLGNGWRKAYWPTAILGATLGVWSGMFLEYQPKPGMRVLGFPVPLAVFVLENGQTWTDFVPSPLVQWTGVFANVVFAMAVLLGFLAALARLSSRFGAKVGTPSPLN